MFLSDLAEFKRKSYEEYLRENKPELYGAIQNTRKEITDSVNTQRINKSSNKRILGVVISKRKKNTLRMLREMGGGKENASNLRGNMSWLGDRQRSNAPMQNLRNPLPKLQNAQRGVTPLPLLLSTPRPALPDLTQIPTRWNKPSFDVIASNHNGRTVVNPVRNTFSNVGNTKPVSQVIVPKAPKVSSKDASKMLKNLGIAGVVSGGVLGAYGLKKYMDSRNKEKRKR
jgi:hypothetical protein